MKQTLTLLTALLLAPLVALDVRAAEEKAPSPENHVYQFMTTQTHTVPKFETPSGVEVGSLFSPQTSSAYLWVPPACERIRGVLILGHNVPEQWMGGHPAIRAVCAEQGLGILFTCPTFRLNAVNAADNRILGWPEKGKHNIAFLQQILDALAKESGYEELRTAPWFPIGESMSLQIVSLLTHFAPERCIAGVWVKDAPWNFATPGVPMLAACGTGAEWDFPKHDVFERWRAMAVGDMKDCIAKRTAAPDWPGSLLIEAGSAHFSCTEAMLQLIAQYIRAACRARLSADGTPTLRAVDLQSGYVAGIPVPDGTPMKPKRYNDCTPEDRRLPWYFDASSAQAAFDMANVNWNAKTSVPAFADKDGEPIPYSQRGIADFTPAMEDDGLTFALNAVFRDKLPDGCVKAGTSLDHPAGNPNILWLRGPIVPLGGNRFRLALDRSAAFEPGREQNPLFLVSYPGNSEYRRSVNPASVHIPFNKVGKPQTITFAPIPDQKMGVREIVLRATSDSGMPVRFFVRAGPAEIHGDRLVFTPLPPRTKCPVTVIVVAWQWGRASEPAIQTAESVERKFHIGIAK